MRPDYSGVFRLYRNQSPRRAPGSAYCTRLATERDPISQLSSLILTAGIADSGRINAGGQSFRELFMPGITCVFNIIRWAGSRRAFGAKIFRFAIAAAALSSPLLFLQAMAPSAEAAQLNATAPIQALLDNPVNGVVNLPSGTFTIRPV